ncbi:MAG: hypothetical protein ACRCVT_01770, partial [Leadbetterella sp.]
HSGVLRRERYVFNNTQLFGYSFSIKKGTKTKLYGNIIGALDKKNVNQATNFRYFLPNQNELIIDDSVQSNTNSKNIMGVLKFERSWGDHTFLQINSSISKSFSLLDQSFISQNLFFPEDFDNENKSNIWRNSQNIHLSRKVSKTLMMDVKMKYLLNNNSQNIQNNSQRYNEFFGVALPIQQINQPVSQLSDRFSFFSEILKTKPKLRYKIKANIEIGKEEISNSLRIDTNSKSIQTKESIYYFSKKVFIIGGEILTRFKKSNLAIGLDVLDVNLSATSIKRFSKPVLSPMVVFSKRIKEGSSVDLVLTNSISIPTITTINPENILTNYRTFSGGNNTLYYSPSHLLFLTYKKVRIESNTFFYLNTILTRNFNTSIDSIQANDRYFVRKNVLFKDPITSFNAFASINQKFQFLTSQIMGTVGFNQNQNVFYFNTPELSKNRLNSFFNEISASCRLSKFIFLESGLKKSNFSLKSKSEDQSSTQKTIQSNIFYVFRFKYNKLIYSKIKIDQFDWKQESQKKIRTTFVDLSNNISFKKSKWSLDFDIMNIFNEKTFSTNTLNFNLVTQNYTRLQPRIFVVRANYIL